ncbi:AMP-binding protein [Candidatus Bathyarchaeota archaeon]|nr:AMP-binding protein [Candidatus Bathyarchaeota archaeon]
MSIEEFEQISHFLNDYIEMHAREKPEGIAIIDADTGKYYTWQYFRDTVNLIALELLENGWEKGDIIISMLPLLPEHVFLEYACIKLGITFCPLDVRLKSDEVIYAVTLLSSARRVMFVHPDDTDSEDKYGRKKRYDFKQFARRIRKEIPAVQYFMQMSMKEDCDKGTVSWLDFIRRAKDRWLKLLHDPEEREKSMKKLEQAASKVEADDAILIIYTTGTTGFPKPAMLTNEGIIAQNLCLSKGFNISPDDRMLVNLPPSHVGCQTEQLMTTIFVGGISVILHSFKAEKSLKAIQTYKVTAFGQIPALYVMEWRLPDYDSYDLSSLRFALYGGQGVSLRFLQKLKQMAPYFGSGLGLTELSGFCSYTPLGEDVKPEDILASLGHDYPITPLSIREPMNPDGTAGKEKPVGENGEVCYSGPQVFKGYYGNKEATRKTISKEGICYTGDLGFKDEDGNLHLVGRSKFVIKPKGYQVNPEEVEQHLQKYPGVSLAAVVGYKHEVFSEGIVAFIETRRGKKIPVDKLREHCKQLASYKRPLLYVFLDEIPLNRVEKTDYAKLKEVVGQHIESERSKGGWDASKK